MKPCVGNLPWRTTDAGVEELFSRIGKVISAHVATDKLTSRSRGFGFVEIGQEDGQRASAELDGHQIGSIALRVNEVKEQRSRRVVYGHF